MLDDAHMSAAVALVTKKRIASTLETGDGFPTKYALRDMAQDILKTGFSVARCQHKIRFGLEAVELYKSKSSAWFSGTVPCNSIWTCPVCAAKISQERTQEVAQAIDTAHRRGHCAAMVTLTFSHEKSDFLALILPGFRKAMRAVKSGRAAVELREKFGVMGEVRALEVTHGENGWHPHGHSVVFFERPLSEKDFSDYQTELFFLWRKACASAGLGLPNSKNGVDVRPAQTGAEYIAKWGLAKELCRLHIKKSKHGKTPWQLLAAAIDGDHDARCLFRVFAECFKGARQLFWSKGLRAKLDLGPVLTDQAALDLPDTDKVMVKSIDRLTWGCVVRAKAFTAVSAAVFEGVDQVEAILAGLVSRHGAQVLSEQGRQDQEGLFRWFVRHAAGDFPDSLCMVGARPWPAAAA